MITLAMGTKDDLNGLVIVAVAATAAAIPPPPPVPIAREADPGQHLRA